MIAGPLTPRFSCQLPTERPERRGRTGVQRILERAYLHVPQVRSAVRGGVGEIRDTTERDGSIPRRSDRDPLRSRNVPGVDEGLDG